MSAEAETAFLSAKRFVAHLIEQAKALHFAELHAVLWVAHDVPSAIAAHFFRKILQKTTFARVTEFSVDDYAAYAAVEASLAKTAHVEVFVGFGCRTYLPHLGTRLAPLCYVFDPHQPVSERYFARVPQAPEQLAAPRARLHVCLPSKAFADVTRGASASASASAEKSAAQYPDLSSVFADCLGEYTLEPVACWLLADLLHCELLSESSCFLVATALAYSLFTNQISTYCYRVYMQAVENLRSTVRTYAASAEEPSQPEPLTVEDTFYSCFPYVGSVHSVIELSALTFNEALPYVDSNVAAYLKRMKTHLGLSARQFDDAFPASRAARQALLAKLAGHYRRQPNCELRTFTAELLNGYVSMTALDFALLLAAELHQSRAQSVLSVLSHLEPAAAECACRQLRLLAAHRLLRRFCDAQLSFPELTHLLAAAQELMRCVLQNVRGVLVTRRYNRFDGLRNFAEHYKLESAFTTPSVELARLVAAAATRYIVHNASSGGFLLLLSFELRPGAHCVLGHKTAYAPGEKNEFGFIVEAYLAPLLGDTRVAHQGFSDAFVVLDSAKLARFVKTLFSKDKIKKLRLSAPA